MLVTLAPGAYTALLQDINNRSGVGLVEMYDLDETEGSQLANISTRAFVDTGDDVLIGGVIIGGRDQSSAGARDRPIPVGDRQTG